MFFSREFNKKIQYISWEKFHFGCFPLDYISLHYILHLLNYNNKKQSESVVAAFEAASASEGEAQGRLGRQSYKKKLVYFDSIRVRNNNYFLLNF